MNYRGINWQWLTVLMVWTVLSGTAHAYVPVTGLNIMAPGLKLNVNTTMALQCKITPTDATRQNIIWESSDPAVASIDKFGLLTAHAPGNARITVYSWDDAMPLASNQAATYLRNGIQDSIEVVVGQVPSVSDPSKAGAWMLNEATWESLSQQVERRRSELAALISEAKEKGIVTEYASVSEHVISLFQWAAMYDRDHVEEVRRIFKTFPYYPNLHS